MLFFRRYTHTHTHFMLINEFTTNKKNSWNLPYIGPAVIIHTNIFRVKIGFKLCFEFIERNNFGYTVFNQVRDHCYYEVFAIIIVDAATDDDRRRHHHHILIVIIHRHTWHIRWTWTSNANKSQKIEKKYTRIRFIGYGFILCLRARARARVCVCVSSSTFVLL